MTAPTLISTQSSTVSAHLPEIVRPANAVDSDTAWLAVFTSTPSSLVGPPSGWAVAGSHTYDADYKMFLYSAKVGSAGYPFTISGATLLNHVVVRNGAVRADSLKGVNTTNYSVAAPTQTVVAGNWVVSYWSRKGTRWGLYGFQLPSGYTGLLGRAQSPTQTNGDTFVGTYELRATSGTSPSRTSTSSDYAILPTMAISFVIEEPAVEKYAWQVKVGGVLKPATAQIKEGGVLKPFTPTTHTRLLG